MNGESVTIRKAAEGDISFLTNLLTELFAIETDFIIDREKHARGIALVLRNKDSRVMFVAEHKGDIVGMVSGQLVVSTAEGGFSVLLEDMCVSSVKRRLHIGSELLDALEAWGKEKGATRMQLVADSGNNQALSFYEKHNFHHSRMVAMYRKI